MEPEVAWKMAYVLGALTGGIAGWYIAARAFIERSRREVEWRMEKVETLKKSFEDMLAQLDRFDDLVFKVVSKIERRDL